MATREVKVVINGEEYVSKAATSASAGMAGFTSKIPGWAQAAAALTAAFVVVKKVVAEVGEFVMDSIASYDNYAASQVKLAAQSKLTGMSMKDMNALVKTARDEFGLTSVAAVDIAAAVAKFSTAAGMSGRSSEAMAAALELGAAAGMDAKQVAEGLSSAFAGNDEWLNRLGLANPSQLWKDYADANGLAVSKMSESEKKLAVLTAIMDAGNTVAGVYAERMASGAGQQEKLNNRIEEAKIAFGAVIQPIRIVVVQGLTKMVEIIAPLLIGVGKAVNLIGVSFVGAFVLLQSSIGAVAEIIGKLTGNDALEKWGANTSAKFKTYVESVTKSTKATDDMSKAVGNAGKAHELAAFQITASAKKSGDTVDREAQRINAIIAEKLGPPLSRLIGITTTAIDDLGRAGREQLPVARAKEFDAHMVSAAENARRVADRITSGVKPGVEDSAKSAREMADDVAGVARGALDAAQAFGIIDRNAASALMSAIGIAESISKIADGKTFAGVAGLLGGVANIVSMITTGNAERNRLLRENTEQLAKLRTDGVSLSTKASGETIDKTKNFLGGFDVKAFLNAMGTNVSQAGPMLAAALAKFGLRLSDLDAVASDLGIAIRDSKGSIILDALPQLLQGLGSSGLGSIGQSFGDQLGFFKDSQRLSGNTGTGQIGGLLDFLRNVGGVSALDGLDASDPAALRQALLNLFVKLGNGGVGATAMGKLTGQGFSSILQEIIGLIDGLGDAPASASGADVASVGAGLAGLDTGPLSGAQIPQSVQLAIQQQTERMMVPILAQSALQEQIANNTAQTVSWLSQIHATLAGGGGITPRTVDVDLETRRRMVGLDNGRMPTFR